MGSISFYALYSTRCITATYIIHFASINNMANILKCKLFCSFLQYLYKLRIRICRLNILGSKSRIYAQNELSCYHFLAFLLSSAAASLTSLLANFIFLFPSTAAVEVPLWNDGSWFRIGSEVEVKDDDDDDEAVLADKREEAGLLP